MNSFCKRGHARTPDNLYASGSFKKCVRFASISRAKENPQAARQRASRWALNNKDRVVRNQRAWVESNPEKIRGYVRKYKY